MPNQVSAAPPPQFAPSPHEFEPKIGVPGNALQLLGVNFGFEPVEVKFGAVPATLVGRPTNTQLVAVVPDMWSGPLRISVTTAGGTAVSTLDFVVLAPPPPQFAAAAHQFEPKIGAANSATMVTLFGAHFNQPPLVVTIAGMNAPIVGAVADGQVTVVVGPGQRAGSFPFQLQNAAGAAVTSDLFTFI